MRSMRQALRFTVALVVGLALLTWGASVVVTRTTRAWFERDMQLRAELAVSGAREVLVAHWDRKADLRRALVELTHDERVLGAAACGTDLALRARTLDYPAPLSCERLGPEVRPAPDSTTTAWATWSSVFSVPGGQVHATAIPVATEATLGFVVLVHDLSFVDRREATARRFLVLAFGVLALAASVITLVAARLSWRGWSNELRRLIRGESPRPEFRPFLRDVRDLVERLAAERETDGQGGLWTPQRLKNTLSRHLHGERVVIVANREPYIHERASDGEVTVVHPASGLVTALEPVMRACSGIWVAHGSGSADREASDKNGRLRVPPGEESYVLRRVWLSPEEEKGYYYGFSNEGLWPLCHIAHTRPVFRSEDWRHYQAVNRKFADAVCEEVDSDDPIILVQDYHFALAPADDPREAAPGHGDHVLAHPVAQLRAVRDLPLARRDPRRACSGAASSASTPSSTATTSSTASTGSSSRASTGSRTRSSTRGSGRSSGPTRSRSSGRAAGSGTSPPSPSAGRASSPSSASRRTRSSASASTASTTRRASRSGSSPSSGCSSAPRRCEAASPSCSWPRRAGRSSRSTSSSTRTWRRSRLASTSASPRAATAR